MKTSTFQLNGFTFKIKLHQDPAGGFYCSIMTLHDKGILQSEIWPTEKEAEIDGAEIALDWSRMLKGLQERRTANGVVS